MKNSSLKIIMFLILGLVIFTNYTKTNFSKNDQESLLFMLEEEKLAHDVYTQLYEKWETRQFGNIKESEKMHMEKVKTLLDQNKIQYEVLPLGKFKNKNLQKLYYDLIAKGNISEIEALKVGATIEDVDIFDLKRLKKETENQQILSTYDFLECGSRNHLRAFNRGLNMNNSSYEAQYISKEEWNKIINNEHEQCGKTLNSSCNKNENATVRKGKNRNFKN